MICKIKIVTNRGNKLTDRVIQLVITRVFKLQSDLIITQFITHCQSSCRLNFGYEKRSYGPRSRPQNTQEKKNSNGYEKPFWETGSCTDFFVFRNCRR